MIVAMFTNNYLPHVSGVSTSITRLERNLVRRGHDVHIFAAWFPRHRDHHPKVHRVLSLPLPPPFIPLPFPILPTLRTRVSALHPDILHAHHPFLLGRQALPLARWLGCPIVFTYHAMYEEYVHYAPLLPREFLRTQAKEHALAYAQRVDAVIVPSPSIAEILRARGLRTPTHVIPTGVNVELFARTPSVRATTRETWGVGPADLVIVSFARLSHEKNFDLLIEAFAALRAFPSTLSLRLVIGGDGPARPALESRVRRLGLADSVMFVGHVPHEGVPSFLSGGDVFAYTSLSETQGLVTLEALAAGLPAVVADAPGNRDVVEHEVSGLVTAPTVPAVVAGLRRVLEDPRLRSALAARARPRAAMFSEEKLAGEVEALYASLVRPPAGPDR